MWYNKKYIDYFKHSLRLREVLLTMESKMHYKMYKSGKRMVFAGLTLVTIAAPLTGLAMAQASNTNSVSAAEVTPNADADNESPSIMGDDTPLWIGMTAFDPMNYVNAYDTVDGVLTDQIKVVSNDVNMDKAGVYHVTYQVSDKAGNTTTKTLTFTVRDPNEKDTTPPILSTDDIYVKTGTKDFNPLQYAGAEDELDLSVTSSDIKVVDSDVNINKAGVYHVTFAVSDSSGNKTVKTVAVFVTDKGADTKQPYVDVQDIKLNQGDNWDPMKHIKSISLSSSYGIDTSVSDDNVDTSKQGEYHVTYHVHLYDLQSGQPVGKTYTKTVKVNVGPAVADTVKPTISGVADQTIGIGGKFDALAKVSAYDQHDGDVTVKVKSGSVDTKKVGNYTIVYSATDKAGNEATETATIKVTGDSDHVVPDINVKDISIPMNQNFDPMKNPDDPTKDIEAVDNIDGKVTVKVTANNVDVTKPGAYHVTYSASDAAGNTANKTITVRVTNPESTDKTAPIIQTPKSFTVDDKNRDKFDPMQDVLAHDDIDGNVPVKITENTVNVNVKGTYHVTYEAVDKSGNVSTKTVDVVVTSTKDVIKPVINAADLTIAKGDKFDPMTGVSVTDDTDTGLKATVTKNTVDANKTGSYTVTYEATDKAGNKTTKTRNVTVVEHLDDKTGPVISAGDTIKVAQDSTPDWLSYATAEDETDGPVSVKILSNTTDLSTPGTYAITYSASDSYGNTTTKTVKVEVTKTVKKDTTAPVVEVSNGQLTVGDSFDPHNYYSVTDDQDANPTVDVTNNVDTSKAGKYDLKVVATDAAGNKTTKTSTITVVDKDVPAPAKDTTKPVIYAEDKVVDANTTFDPLADVSANDETDGKVAVKVSKSDVDMTTPGKYHVTYEASDVAGNTATKTILVTVEGTKDGGDTDSSQTPTTPSKPDNGQKPDEGTVDDGQNNGSGGTTIGDVLNQNKDDSATTDTPSSDAGNADSSDTVTTTGDGASLNDAGGSDSPAAADSSDATTDGTSDSSNGDSATPKSSNPAGTGTDGATVADKTGQNNQSQPLTKDAVANQPLSNTGSEMKSDKAVGLIATTIAASLLAIIAFMAKKLKDSKKSE